MPAVVVSNAPASTLIDVIGQVRDLFDAAADPTQIMIGKAYEERGAGSAPRILFVPEVGGEISDPIEMGNACSIKHGCDVLIRGVEGDDLARYRSSYALADRVISALKRAGSGRIEWSKYAAADPTDNDAFGAEIAFSFTYRRDVRLDSAIYAVARSTYASAPAAPGIPPGLPGTVNTVDPTVTPKD